MIKAPAFIITVILLFYYSQINAQVTDIPVRDDNPKPFPKEILHHGDFGIGMGLDYGGIIGLQLGYAPIKHLTFFAAGGYHLVAFGWQVGIKGLAFPKSDRHVARPFAKAMYGTNSAIYVDGADEYSKTYLGFTIGAGVELRFGKKKVNGLDIELNIPLRTPEYWQDYNNLKNSAYIDIEQDVLPVAYSIGFHHEF